MLKTALQSTNLFLGFRNYDIIDLRNVLDLTTSWMLLPWGVHFERFTIAESLGAEWIRPTNYDPNYAFLYLHGGGYALGSSQTHRAMVGQISKMSGVQALTIGYRKIPECPFPAALDDALAAYRYLLEEGFAADRIILGGDSAGGGLALALQLALKQEGLPLPSGSVLLSPWVDLTVSGESIYLNAHKDPLIRVGKMRTWGKRYAGIEPLENPLISPIFGDLSGLPPMLIQVSKDEVLYEDACRLMESASKAGVQVMLQEWSDLIHWWHVFWRILPEAEEAISSAALFGILNPENRTSSLEIAS